MIDVLPDTFAATRTTLHRVATHVLARARYQAVGRFGLRASPGGLATPAYGDDHAVVRLAGAVVLVERASTTAAIVPVAGSTLRSLASAAGADIDAPFAAGSDAPDVGDPDQVLTADHRAAVALGDWYGFGWRVVDEVLVGLGPLAVASRLQLWPEHFDAGCDVAVAGGGRATSADRCNLGASPGDAAEPEPYLYVGPWSADRPGDERFWNAPFGAVLRHAELRAAADPVAAGTAFLRLGLSQLQG
jgi:hypothetical protein